MMPKMPFRKSVNRLQSQQHFYLVSENFIDSPKSRVVVG